MGANEELVHQAYDAFGRGDIATVIGMLDEKVEWTSPRTLPHGGDFSGPVQVGKFFKGLNFAWATLPLAIESVNDFGDRVVGVVRANGMRRSGKTQSYGAVHIFEINDGKITRFREYVA